MALPIASAQVHDDYVSCPWSLTETALLLVSAPALRHWPCKALEMPSHMQHVPRMLWHLAMQFSKREGTQENSWHAGGVPPIMAGFARLHVT
jgi:hypothetical protein